MPIDPFRDYTLEDQRQLDLRQLFDRGLCDANGQLLPEIQGVGATALAIQALDDGVPVDMLGRIAYAASIATLDSIREYPEDFTEELDKRHHGKIADVLRAGMAHIRTQADGTAFARWLAQVHQLAKRRAAHAPPATPAE